MSVLKQSEIERLAVVMGERKASAGLPVGLSIDIDMNQTIGRQSG
jgi:hypothetical protein